MLKEAYGENVVKPTAIYKWMASKKKKEKTWKMILAEVDLSRRK